MWESFRSKYLTDNLYSLLKLPLFWYKPKRPVFECCFNANELLLPVKRAELQNQIKSNHFYCHITTSPHHHALWWVKFLRACSRQCRNNLHIDGTYLQTYRGRQCAEYTYIYSVHTVYYLKHTYNYQYTLCTACTHIHTIVCKKKLQQILHRPDTQCHGCTLHGIQW